MPSSTLDDLLRITSAEYTAYAVQYDRWYTSFRPVRDKYLQAADIAGLDSSSQEHHDRFIDATNKAFKDVGTAPQISTTLTENMYELNVKVGHAVYKEGARAAPNMRDFPNIDRSLAENVLLVSLNSLNERFTNGVAGFADATAEYDVLAAKGYGAFKMPDANFNVSNPANTLEEQKNRFIRRAITEGQSRDIILEEMNAAPPTENSIKIARTLLENSSVLKDVPASAWDEKINPEKILQKAASLDPFTALTAGKQLYENGFGIAVEEARLRVAEINTKDRAGVFTEAQILPDARQEKPIIFRA
ncbi:MAG: hypothetical protein U1E36_00140 [Rickettsiales bacterium]